MNSELDRLREKALVDGDHGSVNHAQCVELAIFLALPDRALSSLCAPQAELLPPGLEQPGPVGLVDGGGGIGNVELLVNVSVTFDKADARPPIHAEDVEELECASSPHGFHVRVVVK